MCGDAVALQLLWPDLDADMSRGFSQLAVNVARISC
jgi:hypothetical protein